MEKEVNLDKAPGTIPVKNIISSVEAGVILVNELKRKLSEKNVR